MAITGGIGLATGNFDPRQVAIGGLVGAIPGGGTVTTAIRNGAIAGGVGETANQAVSGNGFDVSNIVQQTVIGGATGGVTQRLLGNTRDDWNRLITRNGSATEAAGTRIPWNSYADYPKVTINGREYANVGGRPYTQHAVDRLQPSGLGTPAGASGPGRSIAPAYVDDVLTGSQTVRKPVVGPNGEARVSHVSGSVEVITEGDIVITAITR
jgi:hypothetical protein